jgi:predicted RNase H-like HicB family nuclease
MILEYVQAALERATYKLLPESGAYYGEIPGFQGVWATAPTLEACRRELTEVLEEWILFRVSSHLALPIIEGLELVVVQESA